MESLIDTRRDSRIEGYPRRREKTMIKACSSNQIYLYLSHYISCSIHGLEMEVNTILLNRVIEEEAHVEKPQYFEVYQKETHVSRWKNTLYGFKQLVVEPLMHNKSMVKNSYDKGIVSKQFFRSLG
jgi:hypothetical protein